MNYNQFLFYNLTQVVDTNHPLKNLEYDIAFELLPKYYDEFYLSDFNNINEGEYQAITNYLNNF